MSREIHRCMTIKHWRLNISCLTGQKKLLLCGWGRLHDVDFADSIRLLDWKSETGENLIWMILAREIKICSDWISGLKEKVSQVELATTFLLLSPANNIFIWIYTKSRSFLFDSLSEDNKVSETFFRQQLANKKKSSSWALAFYLSLIWTTGGADRKSLQRPRGLSSVLVRFCAFDMFMLQLRKLQNKFLRLAGFYFSHSETIRRWTSRGTDLKENKSWSLI